MEVLRVDPPQVIPPHDPRFLGGNEKVAGDLTPRGAGLRFTTPRFTLVAESDPQQSAAGNRMYTEAPAFTSLALNWVASVGPSWTAPASITEYIDISTDGPSGPWTNFYTNTVFPNTSATAVSPSNSSPPYLFDRDTWLRVRINHNHPSARTVSLLSVGVQTRGNIILFADVQATETGPVSVSPGVDHIATFDTIVNESGTPVPPSGFSLDNGTLKYTLGSPGEGIGDPIGWPDVMPETVSPTTGMSQVTDLLEWASADEVKDRPTIAVDFSRDFNLMEEGGPDNFIYRRQVVVQNQRFTSFPGGGTDALYFRQGLFHYELSERELQFGGASLGGAPFETEYVIEEQDANSVAIAIADKDAVNTPTIMFYSLTSDTEWSGAKVFARAITCFGPIQRHQYNLVGWSFKDTDTGEWHYGPPFEVSDRVEVGFCTEWGLLDWDSQWNRSIWAVNIGPNRVLLLRAGGSDFDNSKVHCSIWQINDAGLPEQIAGEEVALGLVGNAGDPTQLVARYPAAVENNEFLFGLSNASGSKPVKLTLNSDNTFSANMNAPYYTGVGAISGLRTHCSWVGDDRVVTVESQLGVAGLTARIFDANTMALIGTQTIWAPEQIPDESDWGMYAGIGLAGNRWLVGYRPQHNAEDDIDSSNGQFGFEVINPQARLYVLSEDHNSLVEIDNVGENNNSTMGHGDIALFQNEAMAWIISSHGNTYLRPDQLTSINNMRASSSYVIFFTLGVLKALHDFQVFTLSDEWVILTYDEDEGWWSHADPDDKTSDSDVLQAFHVNQEGVVDLIGRKFRNGFNLTWGKCRIDDTKFFSLGGGLSYSQLDSLTPYSYTAPDRPLEAGSNPVGPIVGKVYQVETDGSFTLLQDFVVPYLKYIQGAGTFEVARIGTTNYFFSFFLSRGQFTDTITGSGALFRWDPAANSMEFIEYYEHVDPHAQFPGFGDGRNPHQILVLDNERLIISYSNRIGYDVRFELEWDGLGADEAFVLTRQASNDPDFTGDAGFLEFRAPVGPDADPAVFCYMPGLTVPVTNYLRFKMRTTSGTATVSGTLRIRHFHPNQSDYDGIPNDDEEFTRSIPLQTITTSDSLVTFGPLVRIRGTDPPGATETSSTVTRFLGTSGGNFGRHLGARLVDGRMVFGDPINHADFLGATNYRADILNENEIGYVNYEISERFFPNGDNPTLFSPLVTCLAVVRFVGGGRNNCDLTLRNVPMVVRNSDVQDWWRTDAFTDADTDPTDMWVSPGPVGGYPINNPSNQLHPNVYGDYWIRLFWEQDIFSFQNGVFVTTWGSTVSPTDVFYSGTGNMNLFTYVEGDQFSYWIPTGQPRLMRDHSSFSYPWGGTRVGSRYVFLIGAIADATTRDWPGAGYWDGWYAPGYRVLEVGGGLRGDLEVLQREVDVHRPRKR